MIERAFEEEGRDEGRMGRQYCALDGGPGYCRDNEAKARFLPFQLRGGTISRMTDCAIPLAAGIARSAASPSHVVTEDCRRAERALGDRYRAGVPLREQVN